MSSPTDATNAASPGDELAALINEVETLAQFALNLQTRISNTNYGVTPSQDRSAVINQVESLAALTIHVQANLNRVLVGQFVNAMVHPARATAYLQGTPFMPSQLEAAHAGSPEDQPWYVVLVGHEPGIYPSPSAANAQTDGIPNQRQLRQSTRTLALAAYSAHFAVVQKWNPA
ncbi:hypothetical protein C8J57DRAFT_1537488 [Mycena rebaudengoi]|nr:hypothetical protein C8J57DRAFT_1537488 [Mycena rebaudengoi]